MMRVILLISLLACTTTRTVDVLQPLGTVPPGPGYPMHVVVPQWIRPSLLCIVDHAPAEPVYDRGAWHCPLQSRARQ